MVEAVPIRVPLADPVADNRSLAQDLTLAAAGVLATGPYILGPSVRAFEQAFAHWLGGYDAVGTASGTDALVLALLGAGVGPGDEVIAPAHTAGPTVAAIRIIGALPVLVDIDPATFCLGPDQVAAALGPRVKAVVAVHLYGRPAPIVALADLCQRHRLALIEDCAQAAGATVDGRRVGSFGTAGCFSFYPTKNLGGVGDGGCVVSTDAEFLERVRSLRTYGWSRPQYAEYAGGRCSRLDELQAAMLAVKLPLLDAWNDRRRSVAERYLEAFHRLPLRLPESGAGERSVYHLFVVRSDRRDALEQFLREHGIGSGRHYPWPIHHQPGLAAGARIPQPLTVTEQISREILSLPLYYAITDDQVETVISIVGRFFDS